MSDIVESILKERYYQDGEDSWADIVERVVESVMGDNEYKEDVRKLILEKKFIPNSPTLMNAGNKMGQLSACFVLPIYDDMASIGDAIRDTMLVHKSGGGTGFSFGRLRGKGSKVATTGGEASGAVSFMKVIDAATESVKQGGKRRGANMGVYPVWGEDVDEFINCKTVEGEIANFNISIMVGDEFMKTVQEYANGITVNRFNNIAQNMWNNGEPGILFYDTINADNANPHLGEITATNPCGEQPLMDYESCNLGSIDISKFITSDGKLLLQEYETAIKLSVIFLNCVIDKNNYPLPEIEEMSLKTRKIGLGMMGFADALLICRIPYGSPESIEKAEEWSAIMYERALDTSMMLAEVDGVYPAWEGSTWQKANVRVRNSALTCYAPTGTISQIAGCSSGIEPNFSYVYDRYVLINGERVKFRIVHPFFEEMINAHYDPATKEYGIIMDYVYEHGTLVGCPHMNKAVLDLFPTSRDLTPKQHIDIQAAFQINCDAAISKTINCDNSITVDDVKELIVYAWEQGCKGLTLYRDGSRDMQVISTSEKALVEENRPEELFGVTYKRKSGCGKLFVTVNERDGKPYEVFVQTAGAGGCAANSEALGRMISIALRNDVSAWEIKKQLSRVKCDKCKNGNTDGKSCADIIGKCIYPDIEKEQRVEKEPSPTIYDKCPFCGEMAYVNAEGCGYCTKCGESKCQ